MAHFKNKPLTTFAICCLLLAVVALGVSAENKTENGESNEAAAVKAGKDPDGGLRPTTPAEEKKLNAELQKTLAKYQKHAAKRNQDGSLSLVVAPHMIGLTVARVSPDGKIQVDCLDSATQITKETRKEALPEE